MADVCDPSDAYFDAGACAIGGGSPGVPGSMPAPGGQAKGPMPYQYPDTQVPGGWATGGWGQGRRRPPATVRGGTLNPGSITVDPNSGLLMFWNGTSFSLAPQYLQEAFTGLGGGSGADSALGYAELAQREREFSEGIRQFNEELKLKGINAGLDSETSRRQALTSLIQTRNSLAGDIANTSANVAKTYADFASNPRDSVAELRYKQAVGGSTPFGDISGPGFGQYGTALADKVAGMFKPVAEDLNQARQYRDAIPQDEFFGEEVRGRLGLEPTAGQKLLPKFDMGGIVKARSEVGESPISSEGGLNMNIFEPVVGIGMDSGKPYFTMAEPRPDGSRRGEQIKISPLPSEKEKDKKLAEVGKATTQSFGVPKAASGGTVSSAGGAPEEFMQLLSGYLGSLGGPHGRTGGFSTPLPSPRLLAGDPYSSLLQDPDALAMTESGYSALGISPNTLKSTIQKFEPSWLRNNEVRVSFA